MMSFHGFYAPLEQAVDHAVSKKSVAQHSFSYPKRLDFLVQDLTSLGHSSEEIDQNPLCLRIADIVTPASLGGVLYVIEGSTLGAAQIDRAAQRILGTDTSQGRRFWAWSRANNKVRWTAINAHLEHLESTGQAIDPILKGASDTFQALAAWLAPLEQPVLATGSTAP